MALRLSVIRWTQTQSQYVALLGPPDQFRSSTIKRHTLTPGETVLVAERTDGYQRDWYALAYEKEDMEFDEARTRAMATLSQENERRAAGRPSLAP